MEVIHFLWSPQIGGIQRLVLDLATAQLRNERINVAILFGKAQEGIYNVYKEKGLSVMSADLQSGYSFSVIKLI